MEDNYTDNFHDDAEEEEEVLSLRDLPLDEEEITTSLSQNQSIQSSPSSLSTKPHDQFFEFMIDHGFEMRPAEDIISCGKLILFTPQPTKISTNEDKKQGRLHRRSGSLSELESYETRHKSTKDYPLLRTSRSLGDQKLSRFGNPKTSSDLDIKRTAAPIKSVGKYDNKKIIAKPKWYFPMIGITRFPAAMDMRDIKSRHVRQSSLDAEGDFPANRSSHKGSSSTYWRFIKALSCNDHTSVAVTSSICVSHA